VEPEVVEAYGDGDLEAGKKVWVGMVTNMRKQIIAHMSKLPGPIV
jgi:hypothetical protein